MNIDIKALQEELEIQAQSTHIFLPPAIHEDVKLENVMIKQTPVGVNVLEMTFAKDGKKTYYTEWLDEMKTDDGKKKVLMSVLQVLKAMVPEDVLDTMGTVDTLQEFAEKTVMVLNSFKDKALLRLKTVYVKDKVTVPLHSRQTWIENMSQTESKIQMFPRDMVAQAPRVTQPATQQDQAA